MQKIVCYFMSFFTSNTVIAWASVVTAAATGFIALFTYVSSRILKWAEERNRRPMLVFREKVNVGKSGDNRDLYAENVGYGPAINIVRIILQAGELTKHCSTNQPLPLQPLGQRQRAYAYCATLLHQSAVLMLDEPDFHVLIEYDDIFGNHYETRFKNRQHFIKAITRRNYPATEAARI